MFTGVTVRPSLVGPAAADPGGLRTTHFHWNDREDLQTRAGDPAARDAAIVTSKERFYGGDNENGENPVRGISGLKINISCMLWSQEAVGQFREIIFCWFVGIYDKRELRG